MKICARERDTNLIWGGQGLIDDIPSCHDLIHRMVLECQERLAIESSYFEQ